MNLQPADDRIPLVRIRPPKRWAALKLNEVWEFRDLLVTLGQRDVKLRYKQTALGVIWVVLQPLLAAGIFTFVFGLIAKLPSHGIPYFLLSYAGLLGWGLFNNILTRSSTCLVTNANLISKIFFPRLVLPIATIGSSLVDFAVALVMMLALFVIYRFVPPHPLTLLLLPLWLLLLSAAALGLGLWAAALTVSYRDVQYVLPVLTQILLYASPVPYAAFAVPKNLVGIIYLNPLSGVLEAARWSLLGTPLPPAGALCYSIAASFLFLFLGLFVFKRMERRFADVI